jgi:rubrerythrin/rhodanese-related sulfurtransferase
MIHGLTADELKKMMQKEKEKDYLIVDVRQPNEYRLDHIPGSINVPLAELQFDPYMFDDGRKLIFCCTRGSRSKVAALFVEDAGYVSERLYHLENGLFEYSGEVILHMPRVDLFPEDIGLSGMLDKAIHFEKGAYLFYSMATDRLNRFKLQSIYEKMAKDETTHAKALFNRLKKNTPISISFDTYFNECGGRILEGGKTLNQAKKVFDDHSDTICMDSLDFAIELEHSAYDLYKSMAEYSKEAPAQEMFFSLAQAEKTHLDQLIQALDLCV